jgi:GDP-4-dehydro-6-deoxy-D-mannose reductase
MSGTVLVTGAAGFAGGYLLDLLAGGDEPVVGWHRPGRAPTRSDVAWDAVDLMDRAAVRVAIERTRPSTVYHCAGAAHVGRAWDGAQATFSTNVMGTHHLLEALRAARVPAHVVVPSSALVYRPSGEALTEDHPLAPTSPYGLSKLAQELLACHAGSDEIRVTIARAFNHFGPRQDPAFAASGFARQIAQIEAGRQAPEILVGNLEAQRDLTDVKDTVRAYRLIAERGRAGRAYNVGSGRAVAIRDVLDMLVARSRVPIDVRIDPERFRPNDVPILVSDISRIRNEIGWEPSIPLAQTIQDTLDYWRAAVS